MMDTLAYSLRTRMPGSRSIQIAVGVASISLVLALIVLNSVAAVEPSNEHFLQRWQYNDKPVADGVELRTWNWGTEAISNELTEPYTDAPGGTRQVQYYDKSRMEINNPDADPESIWYVTNGLLVVELMTGRMQVGDNDFQDRFPADVPVAGDQNDPNGVTYEVFADFRQTPPVAEGTVYTQRLHPDGSVTNDANMATHNVSASHLDEVTNHRIAGPFWDYMNATGTVYEDGEFIIDRLFPNAYYSTGRPLTEFYWTQSQVGGTVRDVGIQCFERRCLTYTPGNPEGFVVEDGNVGLHYFIWRYETPDPTPTPTATSPEPTATATATPTATVTATPTEPDAVEVVVSGLVDCDSIDSPEGVAGQIGETGVCEDFVGGEIVTVTDGESDTINEIQQLGQNNATGGSFSIEFDHPIIGETIIATGIDYNSTPAQVYATLQAAFLTHGVLADTPRVESISSSDPNAPINEADMRFIFDQGDLAGMNVPQMVANNNGLSGATVAGTFSTVVDGASGEDEVQVLTTNNASGGTFRLSFQHPTAGLISTSPIPYNATAGFISGELTSAFDTAGVGDDAPTVSGGPANTAEVQFVFENGALAGTDVPSLVVNNSGLTSTITVSEVEVLDELSTSLAVWPINENGDATGSLEPGTYEFCFTYAEDTGQSDTECIGPVDVSETNDTFTLTAFLDY